MTTYLNIENRLSTTCVHRWNGWLAGCWLGLVATWPDWGGGEVGLEVGWRGVAWRGVVRAGRRAAGGARGGAAGSLVVVGSLVVAEVGGAAALARAGGVLARDRLARHLGVARVHLQAVGLEGRALPLAPLRFDRNLKGKNPTSKFERGCCV